MLAKLPVYATLVKRTVVKLKIDHHDSKSRVPETKLPFFGQIRGGTTKICIYGIGACVM